MPQALTPAEEKDLAENDPKLLSEIERKRRAMESILCPKPEIGDVLNFYQAQRSMWGAHKSMMGVARQVRYLRDMTPEKWARYMEGDRRVRTRLSHNEVLRVSANQARNPYKVECRAAGTSPDAIKRARRQTRWANEFFPAMERVSMLPLRRRFVDAQNGDGMGVYEVFLTHSYDDAVDFEKREIEEPGEDGQVTAREEKPHEYLDRTENEILALGECAEIGLRFVDAMAVYVEPEAGDRIKPGNHGIKRALIAEKKRYRDVYVSLLERKNTHDVEALRLPKPGDQGWPAQYESWGIEGGLEDTDGGFVPNDAAGEVEHIRYYDAVWYVEIVGGCMVTRERHGLPGVPVFPAFGIVTGSSFLSEALQGITWGMLDIELAANDLLTHKVDATIQFGRAAPIIETDQGQTRMEDKKGEPITLDLTNPTKVRQLKPGQHVTDAFKDFRPRITDGDISGLMSLWQMNGLNPIAQGQSPGADAAGYTVNSLMGASLAPYDVLIENEEKVAGQVIDYVRLMIRDTIKERCYLSVPMEDAKVGGTEWLGLGPEDVDETPCRVTIDPMSDANRMQVRESLIQGNTAGYISRSRVQRQGFGVEDTAAEDLEILEDGAMVKLSGTMIENVFQRVRIAPPAPPPAPPPSGLIDPKTGQPFPPSGGGRGGPEMADPQPPSVGAEQSAASQGITSAARGGQGNGYQPPAGPLNRSA